MNRARKTMIAFFARAIPHSNPLKTSYDWASQRRGGSRGNSQQRGRSWRRAGDNYGVRDWSYDSVFVWSGHKPKSSDPDPPVVWRSYGSRSRGRRCQKTSGATEGTETIAACLPRSAASRFDASISLASALWSLTILARRVTDTSSKCGGGGSGGR